VLSDVKRHLQKSALKLLGYLVAAYVVLKLVPTLKQALRSLEHVSWFDVFVLWTASSPSMPTPFVIVVMAYIIGALGGSIPLPASAGTVGGIAGMLILYGVGHNAAIAAVLLHQAIGLLVPLSGGGIAYVILRRRVGPRIRGPASPDRANPDSPRVAGG
jgi:uncharacterized membrane protein YbhN (UPF0104 family)